MTSLSIHMEFPVAILFVINIFLFLSSLTIVLRLWSRRQRKVAWRLSDYMIIATWFANLPVTICGNIIITKGGIGQHISGLTMNQEKLDLKIIFVFELISTFTLAFVKVSALDLFVSIFPNRKFHIAAYTVMAIVIMWCISYTIASLASCEPIQFHWDLTIPGGHCIDTGKYFTAQAVTSLLLDFIVVTLPMPLFWGLQIKWQKKIFLMCMFGMGYFICIISLLRTILNNSSLQETDFPFWTGEALLLGLLETNLSIINACLPLLQPVGNLISQKVKSIVSSLGTTTLKEHSASEWSAKKSLRKTPFGGSEEAKFKRLQDHLYPLSYDGTTQATHVDVEIAGAASQDTIELQNMQHMEGKIAVTNAWNVSSNSGD